MQTHSLKSRFPAVLAVILTALTLTFACPSTLSAKSGGGHSGHGKSGKAPSKSSHSRTVPNRVAK